MVAVTAACVYATCTQQHADTRQPATSCMHSTLSTCSPLLLLWLSCPATRFLHTRLSVLALLFIPALGWVAFNILQPAFNQLNRMSEMKDEAKVCPRGCGVIRVVLQQAFSRVHDQGCL